jgi:hypothetical protein
VRRSKNTSSKVSRRDFFALPRTHILSSIKLLFITVTGKAFFDVGHSRKDQANRRSHLPGYAAMRYTACVLSMNFLFLFRDLAFFSKMREVRAAPPRHIL